MKIEYYQFLGKGMKSNYQNLAKSKHQQAKWWDKFSFYVLVRFWVVGFSILPQPLFKKFLPRRTLKQNGKILPIPCFYQVIKYMTQYRRMWMQIHNRDMGISIESCLNEWHFFVVTNAVHMKCRIWR